MATPDALANTLEQSELLVRGYAGTMLMAQCDPAAPRASGTPTFLYRRGADYTGNGMQGNVTTRCAPRLTLVVENKVCAAPIAWPRSRSHGVPGRLQEPSTGPRTIGAPCRKIIFDRRATRGAYHILFSHQCRSVLRRSKFIMQRNRQKRGTEGFDMCNRNSGNTDRSIVATLYCSRNIKPFAQKTRQDLIFLVRKLFRSQRDPCIVPTSIVTDKTRQTHWRSQPFQVRLCNGFSFSWVQHKRYFTKLRSRDGMKSTAMPRFAISFIKLTDQGDRTRKRSKPLMFLLQPLRLFSGMITRQQRITCRSRIPQRGIP
jgi:hypothetical protein